LTDTTPRIGIGEVPALTRYVDWRVICEDINRALGMPPNSRVRIAEFLNVPPSTVQRWMEERESKRVEDIGYASGEALLELHRRLLGPDETLRRLREFRERATRSAS
jgi:hypothetical protein